MLHAGTKIQALPVNPDEMETQLPFDFLPGLIPREPPPEHTASVLAEIVLNPPRVDHTLQYKQQFKALVAGSIESRPQDKPAGTSDALHQLTPCVLGPRWL